MDRRAVAIAEFEAKLGHVFADRALLEQALTHPSVGNGARKPLDNDRLEFLGDRVLGLVIADALTGGDSQATSGDLSKRLHGLVSGDACARVARSLGLGAALRLPGGESRRGARDHERILADACEAIIAALYLELGLSAAAKIILEAWRPVIEAPMDLTLSNPKSALQEWAAASGRAPPVYRLVSRNGPDHQPLFIVEAMIEGAPPTTGAAGSLQAAEKAAALDLLLRERGAA